MNGKRVEHSTKPSGSADQEPHAAPGDTQLPPPTDAAAREAVRARHERFRHTARAHFDRWAVTYDRSWLSELVFCPSMRACHEEILRWKADRGGASYRLLDVGCGTANLLLSLTGDPQAERLVGLDFSEEMVRRAHAKIDPTVHLDHLRVIHGDAEHLPFEDASLDVITCCNSFHHYPHQAAVIRGFARVLRPGGLLVLIDGFRDNVVGWFIFDLAVALVEKAVNHAAWSAVRTMLTEAGFSSIAQRKLNVLAPLLISVARK